MHLFNPASVAKNSDAVESDLMKVVTGGDGNSFLSEERGSVANGVKSRTEELVSPTVQETSRQHFKEK
ncbi:uncharacterized [Tachysurus ichikawai]